MGKRVKSKLWYLLVLRRIHPNTTWIDVKIRVFGSAVYWHILVHNGASTIPGSVKEVAQIHPSKFKPENLHVSL